MRCIRPLIANYDLKGNLTLNRNTPAIAGLQGIQIECRKCIPCRLNTAREKAIRAIHETQTSYHDSIFLTLTYAPENLTSSVLEYDHFQNFMKRLREKRDRRFIHNKINKLKYMVTGEYGDKDKRPHWHALIFNYWPDDAEIWRQSETGHKIYRSEEIEKLWPYGFSEFGTITMESAGYVARYAAKKLTHGHDQDHNYHPKHVTSQGLGKEWIEQNWKRTFENGNVILPTGEAIKIPRYYTEWCKVNQPEMYKYYVENVLSKIMDKADQKERKEEIEYLSQLFNGKHDYRNHPRTRKEVQHEILKRKFKRLQENLKL